MPIVYRIRADLELIISTHIGDVSDEEFLSSYRELYADPEFGLRFNQLVDLHQTQSAQRSASALRTMAEIVKQRYEEATVFPKTAIIATCDISFGLSRMYQAFSDLVPGDLVIFRDPGAALAWLRAPADLLDDFV